MLRIDLSQVQEALLTSLINGSALMAQRLRHLEEKYWAQNPEANSLPLSFDEQEVYGKARRLSQSILGYTSYVLYEPSQSDRNPEDKICTLFLGRGMSGEYLSGDKKKLFIIIKPNGTLVVFH